MPAVPGNPIDPQMLSILAANRASGGAPYAPSTPTGSPFIVGGGDAYTPNARSIGGGMSVGNYGQWALPRPAGVSLGYVPTAQTIGSAANDIAPRTLESYLPPPPPVTVAPAKKVIDKYKRKPYEYGGNGGVGGFGGGYSRGASSGYSGSAAGGRGGFGGSSARSGGLY